MVTLNLDWAPAAAFTYLMLPGAGFADFYKHAAPADEVAQSVSCYLQAASAQN